MSREGRAPVGIHLERGWKKRRRGRGKKEKGEETIKDCLNKVNVTITTNHHGSPGEIWITVRGN